MKLPSHLAKRYSQMTPDEMSGSTKAKALISAAMLNSGGKPGAHISDQQVTKAILRPGVINWDASKDAGVWINARKAGGQPIVSATHLDLDKLLHSRYVQQKVHQGQDVMEFAPKKAATPVEKEEAKVVSEVEAKVGAVKEAAKVEAKATALAVKAKATKEAALAGLSRLGFGYLGDEAAVAAAANAMTAAQAAAFNPTCRQGNAVHPAFVCNPKLMEDFVSAQKALAIAAEAAGDEAALKQAAEAGAKAAAAQGNNKMLILGAVAAVAICAAIYFGLKK